MLTSFYIIESIDLDCHRMVHSTVIPCYVFVAHGQRFWLNYILNLCLENIKLICLTLNDGASFGEKWGFQFFTKGYYEND